MESNEMMTKATKIAVLIDSSIIEMRARWIPDKAEIESNIRELLAPEKVGERQMKYFTNQVYIRIMKEVINDPQLPFHSYTENGRDNSESVKRMLGENIENLEIESTHILRELGDSRD